MPKNTILNRDIEEVEDIIRRAKMHYDKQREEQAVKENFKQWPGHKTVGIPVLLCQIITEMNLLKEEIKELKRAIYENVK